MRYSMSSICWAKEKQEYLKKLLPTLSASLNFRAHTSLFFCFWESEDTLYFFLVRVLLLFKPASSDHIWWLRQGVVMNRVHYDIKEQRRNVKELEFIWKQPWSDNITSSIHSNRWEGNGVFTHMLAYKVWLASLIIRLLCGKVDLVRIVIVHSFVSCKFVPLPYWCLAPSQLYDIGNTCGPDEDVCATFDFQRPVSTEITPVNVQRRADDLLSQYRWAISSFLLSRLGSLCIALKFLSDGIDCDFRSNDVFFI